MRITMFMLRETRYGKHSVALTALILTSLSSPILALAQAPPPTPSAAQAPPPPAATAQTNPPSIRVGSELVLVPTLVATKKGDPVFTLSANDFVVADDGVPQKIHLEPDPGAAPLALVVLIETGGEGADQLEKYRDLGTMLYASVAGVPHRIAVVSFDSKPTLVQDFTENLDTVTDAIQDLKPGDKGVAIYDGLAMAIGLLGKQDPSYRREIILLSETVDQDSEHNVNQALQTISDTNTTIYSLAFPSIGKTARHEAGKIANNPDSNPPGGCMSRKPDADGNPPQESVAAQAYDCAGELLPPLALAKALVTMARSELQQNVPRTVAEVSGGEYFQFKNAHNLEADLLAISNHMPNRYLLSFTPQSPHTGMHALTVKLPDYPQLRVAGRRGYWMDASTGGRQ
ncbi:MAG TPA: VWA domain-containing protein [Acidobacteriaceae bacterium]|nr:VWA domain-containing protein [Acidobacteriaceae bacterium]